MYSSVLMEIPLAFHRGCVFNALRVLAGLVQLTEPEGMA